MLRILIADDHPLIRIGLAEVLAERPDTCVEQAKSVAEVRDGLARDAKDVLILDLNMQGENSMEAIPEFRAAYPRLAILVLSIHPEEQAGVRAILAGANGYLNKSSAPDQLLNAVQQVAKGERYVSETLGRALADYLFRGKSDRYPHEKLSEREFTVLLKIAEGFTTAEIAEQLKLNPKTVGTYRSRILEKMGISTTAELTRYVIEKQLRAVETA